MKKAIPFLLCMFLLLSVSAAAEEIERETYFRGGYTYALLEDGNAEILLYGAYEVDPVFREVEDLVIPSFLDGHPVTRIGDRAFWPCRHLISVTIPDSVREVGFNPFIGCIDLTSITLSPDHPYLETVDGVLFSKPDKRLVCYPSGWTETSYVIPEGTRIVGDYAFGNCKELTSIDIPKSVVSIGNGAFTCCDRLLFIAVPDGVTRIESNTFSVCPSMTTITIPDSVTYIGDYAFHDCASLTTVNLPGNVTVIGKYAFLHCDSMTVTIPDSVVSIGANAFGNGAYWEGPNVIVGHGSYAEQYCIDNHQRYYYPDSQP